MAAIEIPREEIISDLQAARGIAIEALSAGPLGPTAGVLGPAAAAVFAELRELRRETTVGVREETDQERRERLEREVALHIETGRARAAGADPDDPAGRQ